MTPERIRLRVMSGRISRSEYGDGYDALIREIAKERLWPNEDMLKGMVARRAGFKDWGAIEEALAASDPRATALRPALESLVSNASSVMPYIEMAVEDQWATSVGIEIVDPENPHDRQQWIEAAGIDDIKGKLCFTSSGRYGDRKFNLHFNSALHPQLEMRLNILSAEADAFWAMGDASSETAGR